MADPDLLFPFNHTGIFTIGGGKPGAITLKAILTVPHNASTVSGHGTLSQATNPPLSGNTALHGVAQPPHIAATYVMQLSIVLDGIWGTKGVATYSYLVGTHPPELPPIRE